MEERQGLVFGPFRLDLHDERLWRGEVALHVHPKALAVLRTLVAQAGQLVTKDVLFAAVWPETVVSESVLTVAIRELRRALRDPARSPQFIETVHRRGYRFIAPVAGVVPAPERPSTVETLRQSSLTAHSRAVPFVGRAGELAQLTRWFTLACQGTRQVVCITGAAGMGKTALVDAFVAQVRARESLWVGHGQCIAQYGPGEPYLPVLEALGRLCRGAAGAPCLAVVRQYAPSWLMQMPGLLPPTDYEALQRTAGRATPPRMLREFTEALDQLTVERPLVLVLEDLQWSDGATLDWLTYVARRRDPARLLLLGTYRPVDAIVRAPRVRTVMTDLKQHQQGAELALDYLSEADVVAYCGQRLRVHPVAAALARALHQRSQGHPLFLVTIVDAMLRQGLLHEGVVSGDVAPVIEAIRSTVPESLREILEQQVQQISPADRRLLDAASIAGSEFSAAAVAAAVNQDTEDVEARLAVLAHQGQFVRSCGLVEWPDGTVAEGYGFIHDLYRATLYDRVPPSRQRRWHLQIGARKAVGYGAQASDIAAELALHFERGRDVPRAVTYLHQAANTAMQRYAYAEAVAHLTKELTLLGTLPDIPMRRQGELEMLTALWTAVTATQGHATPALERIATRAWELYQHLGANVPHIAMLPRVWGYHLLRAELHRAHTVARQFFTLAHQQQEPGLLLASHYGLGVILYFLGAGASALAHLEQALARYDPQQHGDPYTTGSARNYGVGSRAYAADVLWLLGYPDQARRQSQEALTQAQALAHPFTLATTLNRAATLRQRLRDVPASRTSAEAAIALSAAQGFPMWLAQATILRGWALTMQGQGEQGIAQIQQGLGAWRATGAELVVPSFLALLAEAYGTVGRAAAGLAALDEAIQRVHTTGERLYEAELYRLQGTLLLHQTSPDTAQAEACWQQALALARDQQAKAWELRAAMSLAQLWQRQGKRDEARALLAPIYNWFTKGFDTADLQDAKALLEELGT